MKHFQKSLQQPEGRAILLSVKPRFADLIVDGSKLVELRRAVPAQSISTITIYSSSPVQAIVALVDVKDIIETRPTKLWSIAKEYGGGLNRRELLEYFDAKETGFALMLENVRVYKKPINPARIFKPFIAPQSFRYITPKELKQLEGLLVSKVKK